jgi:hypothetical protein
MKTHLQLSRTGSDPASLRTTSLLTARAAIPPAANGKPPRSQNARVAYHRNEIGAGKMTPLHTIYGIVEDDFESGVPASEHLAWVYQMVADFEVMAIRAHARRLDQPIPLQIVRELIKETACEGSANVPQARVVSEPTNVAALESFAEKGTRHYTQLGASLRLVRHQLAVVNSNARRVVYGATRPSLELSR